MEHAPFVHLHTHSEYSILDGSIKIGDLVKTAVEHRMPALALTDHGNMFGALEFYKKAMAGGIKPIIGEEFYLASGSRKSRKPGEKPYHLVLLARNEEGYRNLITLSSKAFLEGFYYKPRIDMELLQAHAGGLIGLSACLGGEIPNHLMNGRSGAARKSAARYVEIMGREHFYLELMDNGIEEQRTVNEELLRIAREMNIGVVATNDIHYLKKEDAEYHDALLCIGTGKTINETKRFRFKSNEFYFKSPAQMAALFADVPEAVHATIEITEKCNLSLDLGKLKLPRFPIPEGYTADSYLGELTVQGIERRYGRISEEIKARMTMELGVIKSMGFSTYFLIVWDFIRFARGRGIAVGPGRGSAAGSIVAYALGITDVDPLRYGLIFERFLNVSRISMPDIDIDFDGDRRDEVIGYVRDKYGNDRVAQIITFGALKARAAVRDVARAMDIPPDETDRLAKLIPAKHDITIDEAVSLSRDLSERMENDPKVSRLIEIARKLEKLVRHPSTHAAGVVISPTPLTNIVPLYRDPKSGVISTQYQMKDLEDVGLIKMDFLGLKNLTIIQRCLKNMEKAGLAVPDMNDLDLDDPDVYDLLSRGRSMGLFQLESSGMQNVLKQLGPNRFDDIIAVLALYRPGPLDSGMVEEFIERKHGRKPTIYPHPDLENVLGETYGVIVYQEQVMEIARVISGFSMSEADNLRKAMGKKKIELLEEAREKVIEGAVKNNTDSGVAEEIFELMKTFGRYGFNKSHSTAYALLAFQTAYLKVHFPLFYHASLLSGELHDTDKICQYVCEARESGIDIKPPDVNGSDVLFEVDGDSISYALAAVKNVGESAARSIVAGRKSGPYTGLADFASRVDLRLVNRRVVESLIKSGAFDALGENRRTLFENTEGCLEYGAQMQGDRMKGQAHLFQAEEGEEGPGFYRIREFEEWEESDLSEYEKEALGFYFMSHPLLKYDDAARKLGASTVVELKKGSEANVRLLGVATAVKVINTKDGKEMAFVTLEDLTGGIDVVLFPEAYAQYAGCLSGRNALVVTGRVDGEKIIADRVLTPEEALRESVSTLHVMLKDPIEEKRLLRLRDLFIKNKGNCTLVIHTPELYTSRQAVRASAFLLVDPKEELLSQLRAEELIEKAWIR